METQYLNLSFIPFCFDGRRPFLIKRGIKEGTTITEYVPPVSEPLFYYYFGMDCAEPKTLDDGDKAMTILKIWGIYRGGLDKESIMKMHNLKSDRFERLITREYMGLKITILDNETIKWTFPKLPAGPN